MPVAPFEGWPDTSVRIGHSLLAAAEDFERCNRGFRVAHLSFSWHWHGFSNREEHPFWIEAKFDAQIATPALQWPEESLARYVDDELSSRIHQVDWAGGRGPRIDGEAKLLRRCASYRPGFDLPFGTDGFPQRIFTNPWVLRDDGEYSRRVSEAAAACPNLTLDLHDEVRKAAAFIRADQREYCPMAHKECTPLLAAALYCRNDRLLPTGEDLLNHLHQIRQAGGAGRSHAGLLWEPIDYRPTVETIESVSSGFRGEARLDPLARRQPPPHPGALAARWLGLVSATANAIEPGAGPELLFPRAAIAAAAETAAGAPPRRRPALPQPPAPDAAEEEFLM